MTFPSIKVNRALKKKVVYYLPNEKIIIIDPGYMYGNIHIYEIRETKKAIELRSVLDQYLSNKELSFQNIEINEIPDDDFNLKRKIFEEKIYPKGLWIETFEEIFPDFIAYDDGDEQNHRIKLYVLISIRSVFYNLLILRKRCSRRFWKKFADGKVFEKVQTKQFNDTSAFQVYFDDKKISPDEFIAKWERKISELTKDLII